MEDRDTSGNRSRHRWLGPLVVGLLALVLRLAYLLEIRHNPFFYHPIVDAWDYDRDAWNMVATGNWVGTGVFFQAPLFTYFLAALYKVVGHNLLWPRLVQVLLGTLTTMGVFILGRRIFGEKAAWIAGIAVALYSLLIFYEGELLAPTLTVFLDVIMFLVLFAVVMPRSGWLWGGAGLVFGLRALATTNVLAVTPVLWAWVLLYGRRMRWPRRRIAATLVAFTLGTLVAIAPVTLRNWAVRGEFIPISSNAGLNFYLGNSGDYQAKVAIRPGAEWDELMDKPLRAGIRKESAMSAYFFDQTWEYIRTHPSAYLRLLVHKANLFVRGDELLRNQEIYPFRSYSVILRALLWKIGMPDGPGLAFPFGLLLPLAWPGLLLAFRKPHWEGSLLAAFAVAYSLSVIAFFITARYRMPVVIPLILLAAYGWTRWRDWWTQKPWRAATLAGVIALFLVSNWNPGRMSKEMNPDAYYSLASTLKNQGDLGGAEQYYKKAIGLNPKDASAWFNLGFDVYQEQRMYDKAESAYRTALVLRPHYAMAVFSLGYLAELRGRPQEAESLYYRAAQLDSLMPGPYHNLALMALSRRDYERAQGFYRQASMRDPYNPDNLIGLGITAFKLRGLAAAMPFFDRARSLDARNPDLYYNLALVYAQAGLPSEAADAARRVIQLDPADNQAYIILADQMRLAGRIEEARTLLEQAVRRRPDLAGPREALTRLDRRSP